MLEMNMGFLLRNLMDETKRKRYTRNREKQMKKLYGILPDKQITNVGNLSKVKTSGDGFENSTLNLPHKDKNHVMKQSNVRQNLISEMTNSPQNKK